MMGKIVKYRTLIVGILSPVLAGILGTTVYLTLTRSSENRDANFLILIDRQGLLRPAPSTDEPFEHLVAVVDELLERTGT